MSTFTSEQYCSVENNTAFQGLYSHDRGTASVTVKDDLITSAEVAQARARSELLQGAYAERWVSFKTVYVAGLKQNDIIKFKGLNWILKEYSFEFSPPVLIMNVKGLRYE